MLQKELNLGGEMNAKVNPAFWADKGVESLDVGGKLAALWLMTNPHTNMVGYCAASSKRFAFETGLSECVLLDTAKSLPTFFKVGVNGILVIGYVTQHFGAGDNLQRNNLWKVISQAYLAVDDGVLRDYLLHRYSDFMILEASNRSPLPSPPQGGVEPPMRMRMNNENENELLREGTGEGEKLIQFLNDKTSSKFRGTEKNLSLVNSRLREVHGDRAGIEKMIIRQVKLWTGTKYAEYLQPSTLFGKENFEKYYAKRDLPVTLETTNAGNRNGPNYHVALSQNSEDFLPENQMKGYESLIDPDVKAEHARLIVVRAERAALAKMKQEVGI